MTAGSARGRIFRFLIFFSAILLFLPVLSGAGPRTVPDYKEGEVLVKFKEGYDLTEAKRAAYNHGVAVVNTFPFLSGKKGQPYLHLRSDRLSTEALLAQLKDDPRVESVSPNYILRVAAKFPDDSRFSELWGLHNIGQRVNGVFGTVGADIGAPLAWDTSTGDSAMVVAVVDTGVDFSHEDLFANMWVNPVEATGIAGFDDDHNGYIDDIYGINAIDGTSEINRGNPSDNHGHGTHTSGTIAGVGNNGLGVTGVNWQARIMGVKSFDSGGSGFTSDSITGIEYVTDMKVNHGVNVVAINASWGGGGFSQLLADAIEAAGDAGIVFVAAAGNSALDNDTALFYPASYNLPNIISVAATNQNDNLAQFSNYGLTSVDLAAPGVNILSTLPGIVSDEPFFDDMDSGTVKWVSGGTPNTWARTTFRFHSEGYSWTDSPSDNYKDSTNSYLSVANDINLYTHAADLDLRLRFWANVALEKDVDFLYVEISNDSGVNWARLAAISDQSAAWNPYSYQIPAEYRVREFRFRFRLVANANINYDGVYIDDVGIANNSGAGPSTKPFLDNMESGTDKWVHDGIPDTWAQTHSRFHSEGYSWTDSPSGDYPNGANSYLSVANDINLSAYDADPDLRLRFWANIALEKDADFLYVEISKDSGVNFSPLAAISDQSAAWALYSYQIPADYRVKKFRFRFHLVADADNRYDGVYIDDVDITKDFGSGSNNYDFMDGTSMAAPHVTGAIALVSAIHPTDTATQKINRVLSGVDRLVGLEGLVATAGRLNLNNTLNSTYKIKGTITTTEAGNPVALPLPKVLVKLVDLSLSDTVLTDTVMTDTTNASGQYSLFGQKTRKYKVVPELAGYKFLPVYRVIDSLTKDTTLNFSAAKKVYALSGAVTKKDTHGGLSGVDLDLALSDTRLVATVRTGTGGSFNLGTVLPGSYNFTPSKSGWVFEPVLRNLTVVDRDITGLNFIASLDITLTGPHGTPSQVLKGEKVNCAVGATNILNNPISYRWTAEAGHFLKADLITSSGLTSNLQNPVWVADISMPPQLENYPVQISVTVSCTDGYTRYAFFREQVNQTPGSAIIPDIGGGGAVGPLAVGISALLGWWKRRKRR